MLKTLIEHVSLFRRGSIRPDVWAAAKGLKKTVQTRLIWSCKFTVKDDNGRSKDLFGMTALRSMFDAVKDAAKEDRDLRQIEEVGRYKYFLDAEQREQMADLVRQWSPAAAPKAAAKKVAAASAAAKKAPPSVEVLDFFEM